MDVKKISKKLKSTSGLLICRLKILCLIREGQITIEISYGNPVTFICEGTRPQKCYQIKRSNMNLCHQLSNFTLTISVDTIRDLKRLKS